MARMHGSQCRVYLGARDASGDLSSIEPTLSLDTEDSTTFASAGYKESDGGLVGYEVGFEGFHDSAVGGFGRTLEVPGVTFNALSIVDGEANAQADIAQVFGPTVLESVSEPIEVASLIKRSGTLRGHGRMGAYGKLLHPLAQETITGSGTAVDNTVASDYGGRFNLHVTAVTGSWDIVVEQSSDNGVGDPWATKATFPTVVAATPATHSASVEVTGTIERYLRVTATETVAGSCTFVVTGARYTI